METKELKIDVPTGYEIDRENSTFECIKFKPKGLTYEDVAYNLFNKRGYYFINANGMINTGASKCTASNNTSSQKQLEKLLAINKLMNVAKYLNGDWKPDWTDKYQYKWYICSACDDNITTNYFINFSSSTSYFKSQELAQQAIDILGEDTIRLALSTDW